jgi:hypothetical protein
LAAAPNVGLQYGQFESDLLILIFEGLALLKQTGDISVGFCSGWVFNNTNMISPRKFLIAAAMLIAGGVSVYQLQLVSFLQNQFETIQREDAVLTEQIQKERDEATNRLGRLEIENASLRSSQTQDELSALRGEVAQLKAIAEKDQDDPIQSISATLVSQIGKIRKWLEQKPRENVPELRRLSASDWLRIAAEALDRNQLNNFAVTSSRLRLEAKKSFVPLIGEALDNYILANSGRLPSDIFELKPYFASPVDDEILQRYHMLHTGNVSGYLETEPLVAENEPEQKGEYDAIFRVGAFASSFRIVNETGEHEPRGFVFPQQAKIKALFKQ